MLPPELFTPDLYCVCQVCTIPLIGELKSPSRPLASRSLGNVSLAFQPLQNGKTHKKRVHERKSGPTHQICCEHSLCLQFGVSCEQSHTISILPTWPRVFLLLSLRNSGTGVEFWGQRICIFKNRSYQVAFLKGYIQYFTFLLAMCENWYQQSGIETMVCGGGGGGRARTYFLLWRISNTKVLCVNSIMNSHVPHQPASNTFNPWPNLSHLFPPVSYDFKANTRHHIISSININVFLKEKISTILSYLKN